jgi:DUF3017 family protein
VSVRAATRRVFAAQWPIVLVVLVFVVAFALAAANFWRRGALMIGIGVSVAAVLRLVLTDERAGLLVVRSKGSDFVATAAVAAAIFYIAWTIDPLGTK